MPITDSNHTSENPQTQAPKSGVGEPFYHVLNGHHRLEAAKKLGLKKVPVYLTSKESNK